MLPLVATMAQATSRVQHALVEPQSGHYDLAGLITWVVMAGCCVAEPLLDRRRRQRQRPPSEDSARCLVLTIFESSSETASTCCWYGTHCTCHLSDLCIGACGGVAFKAHQFAKMAFAFGRLDATRGRSRSSTHGWKERLLGIGRDTVLWCQKDGSAANPHLRTRPTPAHDVHPMVPASVERGC